MSFFVDSTSTPSATEIEETQLALERDGEELLRIESTIASLSERRRAVQSRILIRKALISPVRLLPTEILQRIFKACLPDQRYIEPSLQSAPLLLCQICRRWREVAEATSELWISIATRSVYFNKDSYPAMVARWLAASHGRPLAVDLLCYERRRYSPSAVFQPYSALIYDLCIRGHYFYVKSFIADVSPNLKSLTLHVSSVCTPPPPDFSLPHSSATTGVSYLILRGQCALTFILPTTFPQMTHLALRRIEEVNLGKILVDFPSLVELNIETDSHLPNQFTRFLPPASPAPPIIHRTLEILRIDLSKVRSGTKPRLASIFDSLSLPSLQELAFALAPLRGNPIVEVWLPDSVKALCGRSSCSAKQLHYLNFKPPLHMNDLSEQLKSVGVALRVDNGTSHHYLPGYIY